MRQVHDDDDVDSNLVIDVLKDQIMVIWFGVILTNNGDSRPLKVDAATAHLG